MLMLVCMSRGLEAFRQNVLPFGLITRASDMSQKEREMGHWFVLNNRLELDHYLEHHKNLLENQGACDITKRQKEEFPKWFKEHMNQLRSQGLPEATDGLWSLANGPTVIVNLYSTYISNGVRFHISVEDPITISLHGNDIDPQIIPSEVVLQSVSRAHSDGVDDEDGCDDEDDYYEH
ncbi:hypothetical protein ACSBR2_013099 [Camellia fascicularis]